MRTRAPANKQASGYKHKGEKKRKEKKRKEKREKKETKLNEKATDKLTKSVRQFADREGGFQGGRERVANPFSPSLTKKIYSVFSSGLLNFSRNFTPA